METAALQTSQRRGGPRSQLGPHVVIGSANAHLVRLLRVELTGSWLS